MLTFARQIAPRIAPLVLGGLLGCASGEPVAEAPEADDTAGDEDAQTVRRVPVGGCAETELEDGVRRVDAQNAGWSYFVPEGTGVQCEDTRVMLTVTDGLNIVITSFASQAAATAGPKVAPIMLETAAHEIRQLDADAQVGEAWEGTFGESELPGLCTDVLFNAEGADLRTLVCAGWRARPDGLVHMFFMVLTDHPEGMKEAGLSDQEAFGTMADNWAFPSE
jgi:hypothetical protein